MTEPQAPKPVGVLVFIGVPIALEVAIVYVLIAVETPLSPIVNRLQQNPAGMFVIATVALAFVIGFMIALYSILERRRPK